MDFVSSEPKQNLLRGVSFPSWFFFSFLFFLVSTCITTCKKTAPPPVPPRTTSKPFISVTVQSSTESAQDNYLDQQDRRSEVNSQSSHAHSNSSDSLDSTRANSLARGIPRLPHIIATPVATTREPAASRTANASTETSDSGVQSEFLKSGSNRGSLAAEEAFVPPVPRRKLSSIGIQVDRQLLYLCRWGQVCDVGNMRVTLLLCNTKVYKGRTLLRMF